MEQDTEKTLQELQLKLRASQMGGPGLTRRVQAIQAQIEELTARLNPDGPEVSSPTK